MAIYDNKNAIYSFFIHSKGEMSMMLNKKTGVIVRALTLVVCAVMLLCAMPVSLSNTKADTVEQAGVSRLINVVYDDSNSMIAYTDQNTGKKVSWDTWCQAKYSLEVFASMMQEKDEMNVYFMSDFNLSLDKAYSKKPTIAGLSGADSQKQSNISKIHNTVTDTSGTYFNAILAAYDDLQKAPSSYDEKWLVVITDGQEFTGGQTADDLNNAIGGCATYGVKTIYLAIGDNVIKPNASDSKGVYVYESDPYAATSKNGILNRVTEICQRIFQRPSITDDGGNVNIGIPVSEIIVFAQGDSVSIGDVSGANKHVVSAEMKETDISKATKNSSYLKLAVATKLSGTIVTFTPRGADYFTEGTYNIPISADNYVIYYKPCLDVVLNVIDADGNKVTDSIIPAADYTIEYGLTYPKGHAKAGEMVSTDLFRVDYTLSVTRDGVSQPVKAEKLKLEVGQTEIKVTAKYLNYISSDKSVKFAVEDFTIEKMDVSLDYHQTDYVLSKIDSDNKGITVKATRNGEILTGEDWENTQINVTSEKVDFKSVKNDDGTFTIYPTLKGGDRKATGSGEVDFTATVNITNGYRTVWRGVADGKISVYDDVNATTLGVKVTPDNSSVKSNAFNEVEPTATVTIDWAGNNLTKEQYDALSLSVAMKKDVKVKVSEGGAEKEVSLVEPTIVLDPYVEGQPTTAKVYFKANGDSETQRKKLASSDNFIVTATIDREGEVSTGSSESDLGVKRSYVWYEIVIPLLILIWLIGYLPFIKKYLPGKMKYRYMNVGFGRNGERWIRPYRSFGTWLSVIIPYVAVKATIKVSYRLSAAMTESSVVLKIKAKDSSTAEIRNAKQLPRDIRINTGSREKPTLKYSTTRINHGTANAVSFIPARR